MAESSGPQWCARFASSKSLDDLVPDFSDACRAFLSQLAKAGASVSIADTYRPPQRAYLMHWCCMIGGSGQDSHAVPPMQGVNIDWTHGESMLGARDAARQMMAGYQIKFPAALESRHTQGRAIDMTIGWKGALNIRDFNGQSHAISGGPQNGSNPELIAVGKTYGVIKLVSDPPHWSDDGH
jgi:D-alanyl-D-alanine dipeptidase